MVRKILLALLIILGMCSHRAARAEVSDPLDNNLPSSTATPDEDEQLDKQKTADQLIAEAEFFLEESRPLDARTKLLRALEKDPGSYKAHILLADYYMVNVGHFRLSLKHIKQAQKLFEEQNGLPPYPGKDQQLTHSQLLYLISQARLNLDDYQGSLAVLDEYKGYGYKSSWYPGTRAWVLMKLHRIDDAIREARAGVLEGAEPGRTLNMLGILLSMHGQRDESLGIFHDAIAYELSQGTQGQPATPLNNSGEVYKEIFDEDKAESSWLKATSMPDGCEHVLPSLNLTLLYLDELNLSGAKHAMDNFESCVAQFPLRNGEEHRALVELARGRIALLSGHPEDAVSLLGKSLEDRQWFGKIGTSEGGMKAAALVSIAQAYRAASNSAAMTLPSSIFDRVRLLEEESQNALMSWWYFRKARHVLSSELTDFADLNVRNTDSLLEYPTLGDITEGFGHVLLERKIEEEKAADPRKNTAPYYSGYYAQNLLASGNIQAGLSLIKQTIESLRAKYDDLLLIHLMGIAMNYLPERSPEYAAYSERMYALSHAALHLYGDKLVVSLSSSDHSAVSALSKAGFVIDNSPARLFHIDISKDGDEYSLVFSAPATVTGRIKANGRRLDEVINRAVEAIFTEEVV